MKRGRLHWYHPDELTDEQRKLYDDVVAGPRSVNRRTPLTDDEGRIYGPHNAMLAHPPVGNALQALGASLRFAGTLPRHLFEMLVLLVAVERNAPYEWYAHAPIAQAAGLSGPQMEAIRRGKDPALDSPAEAAVLALARACLVHDDPGDEIVAAVEHAYGREGVTEVVTAIGLYDLIGTLMRTWAVPLPDGATDPLREPVALEGS